MGVGTELVSSVLTPDVWGQVSWERAILILQEACNLFRRSDFLSWERGTPEKARLS